MNPRAPRWLQTVGLAILALIVLGVVPAGATPSGDTLPLPPRQSVTVNYAGATETATARDAIAAFAAAVEPASLDLGGNGLVTVGVTNVVAREFPYVKLEVWSRDDRNGGNPRLWVYFAAADGQTRLVEVPVAPPGTRRTWDDWRMTATYNPLRLSSASLGLPYARFDPRSPTDIAAIAQQKVQWQTLPAGERTKLAALALGKSLLGLDPQQVEDTIERRGLEGLEEQGTVRFLRSTRNTPVFILATSGPYALTADMTSALAAGWDFLRQTDPALTDTMVGTWKSVAAANGTNSMFGENDVRASGSVLEADLGISYFNGRRVFAGATGGIDPASEAALRLVCESRQIDDQRYWGVAEGEESWRVLRPDAFADTIEADANGYVKSVVDRWYRFKKIPNDRFTTLIDAVDQVCPAR